MYVLNRCVDSHSLKKIASNWHETTEFEGLSTSTLLKFKIRIQHGNILKHLKVLMHETKKINLVLREKLRRSWAELQYVWCDWQLGLKLFIIQYGWLSDEAKGGWREKASRRGVGGDMVHFVVHLRAGNVIFFFSTLWTLSTLCTERVSVVILLYTYNLTTCSL